MKYLYLTQKIMIKNLQQQCLHEKMLGAVPKSILNMIIYN
jgi:hypothetical protein